MVAEEETPLRRLRDRRRLLEDLDHRHRLLSAHRHEHARHHRELERHVALVAVPKYSTTSAGHWFASASSTRSGYSASIVRRTRFRNSWVSGRFSQFGALTLEQVRHRVEPQAVEPEVEPVAHDVEHRVPHLGVVVVEVGLVREEAVPVVLAGHRIPRPVRRLRVDEDDPGILVAVRRCRTTRTNRAWVSRVSAPPGTTRGRSRCGSSRGRRSRGCPAGAPPRRTRRSAPWCRSRGARRSSRRCRTRRHAAATRRTAAARCSRCRATAR